MPYKAPPKGIKIFAVYFIILGAFFILASLSSTVLLCYLRIQQAGEFYEIMPKIKMHPAVFWPTSIFAIIVSVLFFISGISLLKQKKSSHKLTILSCLGYIVNFIINILLGIPMAKEAASRAAPHLVAFTYKTYMMSFLFGLVLAFIITAPALFYFSRPNIKRYFASALIFLLLVGSSLLYAEEERLTLKDGGLGSAKLQKEEDELLDKCREFEEYFEKTGILYNDNQTQEYVNSIASKLLPESSVSFARFEYKIIRDPTINAFALPSGKIYLNTGLLARLKTDAQLASVLAHEISHTINRDQFYFMHSLYSKTVAYKLTDIVLTPVSMALIGTDLAALGLDFFYAATVLGYGRAQEAKADEDGFRMMKNAGFQPKETVKIFDMFMEESKKYKKGIEVYFLMSHPSNKMRRDAMLELLNTEPGDKEYQEPDPAGYCKKMTQAKLDTAAMNIKLNRCQHAMDVLESVDEEAKNTAIYHYWVAEAHRAMFEEPKKLMYELNEREWQKLKKFELTNKDNWRKKAFDEYKLAIELDSLYAQPHEGLGFLYKGENDAENAIIHFEEYLKINPNAKNARFIKRQIKDLKTES